MAKLHRIAWSIGLWTIVAPMSLAGSLAPPGGPVAPTMKTLDDIEPRIPITQATTPGDADSVFRIDQPGSYYLIGNVMGEAGKHGIEVASSFVTIDCMGFALIGPPDALTAIQATGPFRGVTVHGANVRGWSTGGVDLSQSADQLVWDVLLEEVGGVGVRVGESSIVVDVVAEVAGLDGISTGSDTVVSNCVVNQAGGDGIDAGQGSMVWSCNVLASVGDGITVGRGSVVSLCHVQSSDGRGIVTEEGCAISDCSVNFTQSVGVALGVASSLRDSIVSFARLNGVIALEGSLIHNVLVNDSVPTGIVLTTDCRLSESMIVDDGGVSQLVLASANIGNLVERTLFAGKGGPERAVQLSNSGNALVDNHAIKLDVPFDLSTFPVTRNLVIGNSALGVLTGFSLNPGNAFGAIINVSLGTIVLQASTWANYEWN